MSFRILFFAIAIFLFLTGVPELQAAVTTYDFVGCGTTCDTSADWWASLDDVDQFPFGGDAANRNTHTQATDAQFDLIESSNNSRWTSADPGAGDEIFMWNEMKINEAVGTITQIDLTWEGFLTSGLAADFSIWVLKTGQAFETDASWVQVGTTQNISGTSDTTMTRSITANFSDYIGANGLLTWGVYESVSSQSLNVDYVKADVIYTVPVTTIANGINPSNSLIAPGASATDLDSFTLQTNTGTDTVTAATVTLTGSSYGGLSLVAITNDAGSVTYCSQSNPVSDTVSLSSCGIPVTTSLTQFKIRITPKSHANMPAPPGSTYSVTGTVTSYTCTNSKSGTDTNSATVTIDNASPANVTSASGSAGDTQVSLFWTNPVDSDFHSTIVLRATSAVADTPVEGTTYIVGNTIGASNVVCVVASPTASCTDTGVSNGTAYHYKIFTRDTNANYSATGVVPTGSPFTPTTAPDITAPAAVSDLALSGATNNSINVSWTAPGDDGSTGTATSYDLRYSISAITADNFSSATQVTGEPAPSVAGSAESMTVSGLSPNTTYYFAIKTSDEVPNTSAISNLPSLSTTAAPDTTPPAAISDLTPSNPSNSAITLTWTAPGDDANSGTAASYDIRYSTSNITEGNWSSATPVSGEPTPLIAGTSQSMTVSGLSASTLYYFAMKTSDEVPNTSAISNMVSLSTTATSDTTAPAAITNLSLSQATVSSIKLTWTAPGDDANSGTAASYDIRYSTSNITEGNWSGATQVSDEPAPQVAGTSQSMTVSGLSAGTLYYFALKTSDEAPNTSAISNVPSLMTAEVESLLFIAPTLTPVSIPRPEWEEFAPKRVMFSGSSYPLSRVELLRKESSESGFQSLFDIKTTILSDGTFKILLGGLARGEQFLGIRAQDPQGRKSNVLSFAVTLLALDNYEVKDILLPPTVEMKSKIIKQDEQIELVGYAGRGSAIEVAIDENLQLQREIVAAASGAYSFSINASLFSPGIHYLSVRQRLTSGIASLFSAPVSFKISSLSSPKTDFNNDDKVNITDWSIFLYRWASEDNEVRQSIDLDQNNEINIADFSVFLKSLTM